MNKNKPINQRIATRYRKREREWILSNDPIRSKNIGLFDEKDRKFYPKHSINSLSFHFRRNRLKIVLDWLPSNQCIKLELIELKYIKNEWLK